MGSWLFPGTTARSTRFYIVRWLKVCHFFHKNGRFFISARLTASNFTQHPTWLHLAADGEEFLPKYVTFHVAAPRVGN
jgi:hypothetical protein